MWRLRRLQSFFDWESDKFLLEVLAQRCSVKKVLNFTKFTGKHMCRSLFFNKVEFCEIWILWNLNFVKFEFCEFCEISKNTFSHRTPLVAASVVFASYFFKNVQKLKVRSCNLYLNLKFRVVFFENFQMHLFVRSQFH